MLLPTYTFNSPIEVYPPTNVRKNFVPTKTWQIFKLGPPHYNGGSRHHDVGIIHFLMTNILQQQFLYCITRSSNQLLNLNIFSFPFLQTFLLINSISLWFDP